MPSMYSLSFSEIPAINPYDNLSFFHHTFHLLTTSHLSSSLSSKNLCSDPLHSFRGHIFCGCTLKRWVTPPLCSNNPYILLRNHLTVQVSPFTIQASSYLAAFAERSFPWARITTHTACWPAWSLVPVLLQSPRSDPAISPRPQNLPTQAPGISYSPQKLQ